VPAGRQESSALRVAASVIGTWRSATPALLPAVAGWLDDPDPVARARAAQLLGAVGPEAAHYAEQLAEALADPAARVADLAAWALSRMGDARCLPRLRNRALIGTSVFDVVQAYYPRGHYPFSAPGLLDVLAPLQPWADELLPRMRSALNDADSYHQRRVLAETLQRWGPSAAPAIPELSRMLDTDAAASACAALGAMGPAASSAAHRLFRLVERGISSRLRAVASWAHWRTSGEPEPAARILRGAIHSEHGSAELRWLGDLGEYAVDSVDRIRWLCGSRDDWTRTEAAYALWRVTGEADEAVAVLLDVVLPLAEARTLPVIPRALECLADIGPPAQLAAPLIRAVLLSDRRFAFFGDWRTITDDEQLQDIARAALLRVTS
jgi:HEAT repeats